jgi:hypothetical protein
MKKWLCLFVLFTSMMAGQAPTALLPIPEQQFFTLNGQPNSNGFVFTYATGTLTPQPTYTDYTGVALNSNPVILNSGGFPTCSGLQCGIWLQPGVSYRIIVQNASHVQQYQIDGIVGINPSNPLGIQVADGVANLTIQAAINNLPSTGGVVIIPSNVSLPTITTQTAVGTATKPVTLLGYPPFIINCNPNNATQSCFQLNNASVMACVAPSQANTCEINNGSTFVGDSAISTATGTTAYAAIDGWSIRSDPAATYTHGVIYWNNVSTASHIDHMLVFNFQTAPGLLVTNGGSEITLHDNNFNGTCANTTPIVSFIGTAAGSLQSIGISGGGISFGGPLFSNLNIDGAGWTGINSFSIGGNNFRSEQCVANAATQTAPAIRIRDVQGVGIHDTHVTLANAGATTYAVEISQSAGGITDMIGVDKLYVIGSQGVNDTIHGIKTASPNSDYLYDKSTTCGFLDGIKHCGDSTVTLNNNADATYAALTISSGLTAQQIASFNFVDRIGSVNTLEWSITKTAGGQSLQVQDSSGLAILNFVQGGLSQINSHGATAVQCNVFNGAGTGGCVFGDGLGNIKASIDATGKGTFVSEVIGSGTTLAKYYVVSGAITPGSTNANTCAEQSFTPAAFNGVVNAGDNIFLTGSATMAANGVFPVMGIRAVANGVDITYCNTTAGALTAPAVTITVVGTR